MEEAILDNLTGQAYVINSGDNVATAISNLPVGKIHLFGAISQNETIICREPINKGHKVSIRRIESGEAVIKYGAVIGVATRDIEVGDCVHVSNMRSNCQIPQSQNEEKFSFEYEVY